MHTLNPQSLINLLPDEVTIDVALQFRDDDPTGDESYADITVNEGNILSGHLDAYCIDVDTRVGITETQIKAKVVSLYDELPSEVTETGRIESPENLDLVGWIINQGFAGKDSAALGGSGIFTFGDVQAAIWTLLGDNYNPNGVDIRPIDQARVDLIIQLAQQNGEDFLPSFEYTNIFGEQVTGKAGILLFPDKDVTDDNPFDRQPFVVGAELAKLGDFVFEDTDRNGIQDIGEQGINGVEVKLLADLDGDGNFTDLIETTTTGDNLNTPDVVESGYYEFTTLPGDYKVVFHQPEGFAFTTQDAGSDDAADSDADPATGMSQIVNLEAGEFDSTIDAGVVSLLAGLGDKVFFDTNRNGIQDAGEVGVSGVTVELTGAGVDGEFGTADDITATTTTDASGMYAFNDLAAGNYKVTFSDLPEGFEFTTQDAGSDDAVDSDANPATGMSQVVTLNPGDFNPTLDAGIVEQLAGLGDKVFEDTNRNGIQDAGEAGVAGVTVELTGAGTDGEFGTTDDIIATTTTDASGMYAFNDLAAGNYKVTFSDLPEGFEFTTQDAGSNDAVDSDANPATGMSQVVTLNPGEFNPTLDAGIISLIPDITLKKFVNGSDTKAVKIAAGQEATFTYAVKNTGEVAFTAADIVITDDNGTANDTSDDFNNLENGLIQFVTESDINGNNLLDAGETWLYTASLPALDLTSTTPNQDVRFYLTGYSSLDGYNGNVRQFTQDGVSVEVSAFSSSKYGGDFQTAYLGAYGGGLGVTNRYESGHDHRVDNYGSIDYLLFEFDQDVVVDKAFLDYVECDSDISIWIGDRNGEDITQLSSELLASFSQENNYTSHGYSRWADFNDGQLTGDTLIISARTDDYNDSFKLKKLDITVPGENSIGTYHNIATVTAHGVSDSDAANYTNPQFTPKHVLIEAEDMHLCGYEVEHVGDAVASGGEIIKLNSYSGYAFTHFTGNSGYYQVDVAYYDENDGRSTGKIKIGSEAIDAWKFDQQLGSNLVTAENRVVRTVSESVYIEQGEQIQLSGWFDYSEYARFDSIKFTEVEAPTAFHYEAEDMDLFGYEVEHVGDAIASGGKAIKLKDYDGRAAVTFDGPSGKYDILVGYYDENDGKSMAKVKVGGETVGSWTFDELLGSGYASTENFREYTVEDVHIEAGEQIKLYGWFNHGEFARFDYVKVVNADADNLGSSNGSNALPLVETDLFNYVNSHAPDLIQASVVTDALI